MYGQHHTQQTKEKIKKSLNKYWTDQRRQQRSKKYTGQGNPMYGKHKSQESIAKTVAHTDYSAYRTQQYRKKMSIATSGERNGNYGNRGQKAKNGRHVFMYDENHILIKQFNTKKLALEFLKISSAESLNKAIKQNRLYHGYYWSQI